jgi:hypothetical protein
VTVRLENEVTLSSGMARAHTSMDWILGKGFSPCMGSILRPPAKWNKRLAASSEDAKTIFRRFPT